MKKIFKLSNFIGVAVLAALVGLAPILIHRAYALPAEGLGGPALTAEGGNGQLHFSHNGDTRVASTQGRFYEAASRGQVFTVSNSAPQTGYTMVAAGVSPLGAAPASEFLALFNPTQAGSPGAKNYEILRVAVAYVSGTTGIGGIAYNMGYNQPITAATSGVTFGNTSSASTSSARAFSAATLTGSTLLASIGYVAGCNSQAAVVGLTLANSTCIDELDGSIVVPPGGLFALAQNATGTTWIANATIWYREATP